MLQLLKESVSSKHAERLEQIIIALIAIEIGKFHISVYPLYHTDTDITSSSRNCHDSRRSDVIRLYL